MGEKEKVAMPPGGFGWLSSASQTIAAVIHQMKFFLLRISFAPFRSYFLLLMVWKASLRFNHMSLRARHSNLAISVRTNWISPTTTIKKSMMMTSAGKTFDVSFPPPPPFSFFFLESWLPTSVTHRCTFCVYIYVCFCSICNRVCVSAKEMCIPSSHVRLRDKFFGNLFHPFGLLPIFHRVCMSL